MRTDAQRIDNIYPLVPMQEGLLFHALEGRGTQATVGHPSGLSWGV